MSDFNSESEWMENKLRRDLVILNNCIRPLPHISPVQSSDKKRKALKHVSMREGDSSFNTLSQKMMGLSNMICLMNAYNPLALLQMDPNQMFGGPCLKTMAGDAAI